MYNRPPDLAAAGRLDGPFQARCLSQLQDTGEMNCLRFHDSYGVKLMMVFSCETFDVESLTITTKNAGSIRLKSVVWGPCTTQGFGYTLFFYGLGRKLKNSRSHLASGSLPTQGSHTCTKRARCVASTLRSLHFAQHPPLCVFPFALPETCVSAHHLSPCDLLVPFHHPAIFLFFCPSGIGLPVSVPEPRYKFEPNSYRRTGS